MVRWISEPVIFGYDTNHFLDYYIPEYPLELPNDNDSIAILEAVTPPVAKQTGMGYSVVIYFWVNEPAVYQVTLNVTKNSLTVTSENRLGAFGPKMMRID